MEEVFDYRDGHVVCTVGHTWLARLLTAPAWHGPTWTRRLWARTGMTDYGPPEAELTFADAINAWDDELSALVIGEDLAAVYMVGAMLGAFVVILNAFLVVFSHGQSGVQLIPIVRMDGPWSGAGVVLHAMGHQCAAFLNVHLPALQSGCRN